MSLISIIVPVYNAEKTIYNTIKSVISQKYEKFEILIIDGGSTDNTLEIIQKFSDDRIRLVSESDDGIYDAMNKGIKLSKGDWVYFLGADDSLYTDDVLSEIFEMMDYPNDTDLILGDVMYSDNNLRKSYFNKRLLLYNSCHHQGVFYNKSLFQTFTYKVSSKISADYELNLKSYLESKRGYNIDKTVSKVYLEGVSGKASFVGYKEEMEIRTHLMGYGVKGLMLNVLTLLRYSVKIILLRLNIKIHF